MIKLLLIFTLSLSFNSYAAENTKIAKNNAKTEIIFDLVNNYILTDNEDIRIGLKSRAGMFLLKSNNKDFDKISESLKKSNLEKKKYKIKIEIPSMIIVSIDD